MGVGKQGIRMVVETTQRVCAKIGGGRTREKHLIFNTVEAETFFQKNRKTRFSPIRQK
jgi:hypothetical protein